jgi:hypothetical protein
MFAFEVVVFIFSLLIQHYSAPWAPIFHATGHEALLWMITNNRQQTQQESGRYNTQNCLHMSSQHPQFLP